MTRAKDVLHQVIDFVFPAPHPLSAEDRAKEQERRTVAQGHDDTIINGVPNTGLEHALAACTALLSAEEARRQSVEARLTSIIGLSSIAGTIVFGTMLTQAGTPHTTSFTWIFGTAALYLTLQVCSGIIAAINGLQRRGYRAILPAQVIPFPREHEHAQLRRQLTNTLRTLADDREHNNDKVTHMAVAHRAMKNYVAGLILLALLATYQGITNTTPHVDTGKSNQGTIAPKPAPCIAPAPSTMPKQESK